ncbi:MAG: crossover junction endodeoxyribonuclease RuvC [Clostridia bacterium]|nr:crossover junction endodeoxyribonuclease RuvC [Clostridia bacterium]MCL6522023.1 crossover junction endodeoxyribonuclease RuvC [Bacillota bacterium]
MRVLGLDPGLRVTGYALLESSPDGRRARLVEGGTLRVPARGGLAERLAQLARDVEALLRDLRPEAVAVEAVHSRSPFPQSALLLAHARGVLLACAAGAGLPVSEYTAADIKKSVTGRGAAGKEQVARMVESFLGLAGRLGPDHVSDAAACALCHLASLRVEAWRP